MDRRIIILIVAALIWLTSEGILILRDRSRRKGTTTIDRNTRYFNAISTEVVFVLAPLICWLGLFRFADLKIAGLFWIGILVMALGSFLRHWSIHVLGKSFRTTVELERDQNIIQSGPYRYIRHPSYSGIVLFFIGYGLVAQNWFVFLIAVMLPTLALLHRIEIEEKALVEGMGPAYETYRKKTKKLIPGIW